MANPLNEVPRLPLVGRAGELAALRSALDQAAAGRGGTLFLTGPAGAGKTRLAEAVREEGARRDFLVATGSAYPLEAGIPYGVICDLLDPLVREEPSEVLISWTRGTPEFQLVCPSLATGAPVPLAPGEADLPDLRNRLLWNLPPFLDRIRRDRPFLLVVEDLQWADPSSLELLHFLGRRSRAGAVLIIGTFRSDESESSLDVGELARSLRTSAQASILELSPLGPEHVREAVSQGFDVAAEVVGEFSVALHRWTGGNPFLVGSILESSVAEGRLRREGGRWVGWVLDEPTLPTSVRTLVRRRLESLSPAARRVANLAAVAGARVHFDLLRESSEMETSELLSALQELQNRRILEEVRDGDVVAYVFLQPVMRGVLYTELGMARTRLLHVGLAKALERLHGGQAIERARELAVHILHGAGAAEVFSGQRATEYLAAAGRSALAVRGDREAAEYLGAALDFQPFAPGEVQAGPDRYGLLMDLARARQHLGHHDAAEEALLAARGLAEARSERAEMAAADRRLGLNMFWARRLGEAVEHWHRGLDEARGGKAAILEARILLDRSVCLQETGQPEAAASDAAEALRIGESEGDVPVQQAAHCTLALLHTWTGPPDVARAHGRRALALAEELGRESALFAAHRALAILHGLTGHLKEGRRHLEVAGTIADRMAAPMLWLRLAEVRIEYCAGLGQWDQGIDLAEESIRMARELDHRIALPRLLIWSGLLHLDRGDAEVGRRQILEACELAGSTEGSRAPPTHTAILAHMGRAALHLASSEFTDAVRMAEKGLALVERSGSRIWGIHRLLPILGEAALHLRDLDTAKEVSRRLRRDTTAFDHPIGLLWADACDGFVTWLSGDVEEGARKLADAAERLESYDAVPHAARVRRQLAGRLAELGDRDAAVRELRGVHDTLSVLGAEPELDKARDQFREVGARPPIKGTHPGAGDLTLRETEIARLLGQRMSNKAIARELGISHRTVGTHLSNIFRKLELGSRIELGDLVRTGFLDQGK